MKMSSFDKNWFKNDYGSKVLQSFRLKDKVRVYGLIEKPTLPGSFTQYEEEKFKILILGRSFSGKTSFINSFISSKISDKEYIETPGIQITNLYWPVKMVDCEKMMVFNLGFWDIGESAYKKYTYIQPASVESLDCRIFIFSWIDRQSFIDILNSLKQLESENNREKIPNIIIGTKFDKVIHSEIDPKLINEIEKFSSTRIINFSSIVNQSFDQLSLVMNRICEVLWDKKFSNGNRIF